MGYTNCPLPTTQGNDVDYSLRYHSMSRRPTCSKHVRRQRRRIEQFDLTCRCKCSLIVGCAKNKVQGCRAWRRELEKHGHGRCSCEGRWLPTCLLDPETPYGCPLWRDGHWCRCKLAYMPKCLCAGCEERQDGMRCDCPRTTVDQCSHVLALIEKFKDLSFQDAEAYAEEWCRQQRLYDPDRYADPPLADAGADMGTRESAIAMMILRVDADFQPHHPDDSGGIRRRPQASEKEKAQQTKAIAQGFKRLLDEVGKGGSHDAA